MRQRAFNYYHAASKFPPASECTPNWIKTYKSSLSNEAVNLFHGSTLGQRGESCLICPQGVFHSGLSLAPSGVS